MISPHPPSSYSKDRTKIQVSHLLIYVLSSSPRWIFYLLVQVTDVADKCEQKLAVAGTSPRPTRKVSHCKNFCSVLGTSARDFMLSLHEASKRLLAFLHHFHLLPPHTFYGIDQKLRVQFTHFCTQS